MVSYWRSGDGKEEEIKGVKEGGVKGVAEPRD